jgi:uncharacterized protein (TIGR03066 family)
MRRTIALAILFLAATLAHADDKEKLLLGKWEPVKAPEGLKATMEFKKEGKMEINIDFQGKQEKMEGTYSLKEDLLTVTFSKDGKEMTRKGKITISEKELKIKDEETGRDEELRKVS